MFVLSNGLQFLVYREHSTTTRPKVVFIVKLRRRQLAGIEYGDSEIPRRLVVAAEALNSIYVSTNIQRDLQLNSSLPGGQSFEGYPLPPRVYLPPEKDTTAHFPLHAHFRAPLSPPPPSIARSASSFPG